MVAALREVPGPPRSEDDVVVIRIGRPEMTFPPLHGVGGAEIVAHLDGVDREQVEPGAKILPRVIDEFEQADRVPAGMLPVFEAGMPRHVVGAHAVGRVPSDDAAGTAAVIPSLTVAHRRTPEPRLLGLPLTGPIFAADAPLQSNSPPIKAEILLRSLHECNRSTRHGNYIG
ncbi:hypothetical protein R1A27_03135 [Methylobacterium sp. NMS12]|uniref:hypothetical protein n=1 Tax=Methylobacterium sp. NMS12 TaxID=3079766 RepID=UPI003F8820B0